MKKNNLLIIIILGAIALLSFIKNIDAFNPYATIETNKIPSKLHGLTSFDVVEKELERYFTPKEYISRVYENNDYRIWAHIVSPKYNYKGQHDPYYCIFGKIGKKPKTTPITIPHKKKTIYAKKITTDKHIFYYWITNGQKTWYDPDDKLYRNILNIHSWFQTDWRSVKYLFSTRIKNRKNIPPDKILKDFIKAIPEEFIL